MTESLMIAGIIVLSLVIVIVRDVRHRQLLSKRMSVEDRIAVIRESAADQAQQFQSYVDRNEQLTAKEVYNLNALVALYRRLEELATSSDVSIEEIQRFAKEAQEFVRQQQLNGIRVSVEAEKLANLLRQRNAA